jgi:hypothetical protein
VALEKPAVALADLPGNVRQNRPAACNADISEVDEDLAALLWRCSGHWLYGGRMSHGRRPVRSWPKISDLAKTGGLDDVSDPVGELVLWT